MARVTVIADSGETRTHYTVTNALINDYVSQTETGYTQTIPSPKPFKYLVLSDGTDAFAINGLTGVCDFGGADDIGGIDGGSYAAVANAALDNLTAGRTWQEKVILQGYTEITDTIIVAGYTTLEILGQIKLAANTNKNMIENTDRTNGDLGLTFLGSGLGITLHGNRTQQTSGNLIDLQGALCTETVIANMRLSWAKESGIKMNGGNDGHIWYNDFSHNTTADVNLNANAMEFSGNFFGSASVNNVLLSTANDCIWHGNRYDAASGHNIKIMYGYGNVFNGEIVSGNTNECPKVDGNQTGIYLNDTAGVHHNIFCGIKLAWTGAGQKPAYAIAEAGAVNLNYNVFSNIIMTGYVTDGLLLNGVNSLADTDSIIGTVV